MARWLAVSPLLYGLYALGCNVLVTSDRRAVRVASPKPPVSPSLQSGVPGGRVPRFGLKGAAGMLLFAQFATATLLWLIMWLNRKS